MDRRTVGLAPAILLATLLTVPPAAGATPLPALGAWHDDGPTRTVIDTLTPLGTGPVALISQNADGVRRSTDGGLTWRVPDGLPPSGLGSAATATTLAVLGSAPSRAYLVVSGPGPSAIHDGPPVATAPPGPTPAPLATSAPVPTPAALAAAAPPGPTSIPAPTATLVPSPAPAASPTSSAPPGGEPSGGPWLYATTDRGASWTQVPGVGLAGRIVFALAAVPEAGRTPVLLAGDGNDGIVRSEDGGVTFAPATRGIAVDPDAGGVVVTGLAAGSADGIAFASTTNGIYRSVDAGGSWTRVCVVTDAMPCGRPTVAPGAPSIVLASAFRGLSRSDDGGLTWSVAGSGVLPSSGDGGVDSVAMSADPVPIAWASGSSGLFRSLDAGITWASWQGDLPPDDSAGSDRVAVDPSDARRVWRVHGLALFTSDDGGRTWAELRGPDPTGIPAYAALAGAQGTRVVGTESGISVRTERRWDTTGATAIALDFATAPAAGAAAGRPATLYAATYAERVLRSDDGGRTWDDWSRGLPRVPVWDVEAPAVPGGRIIAATEAGVFERDAEGDGAWARLGTGLPDAAARTLVVTSGGDVLVGLEARGVWRLPRGLDAWRRDGLDRLSVLSLAALRADGRTLLAATDRRGLWRSTDAGRTWRRVASTRASASVAFDPATGTAVLATGSSVTASVDGGRTWHPFVTGLGPWDAAAPWRRSATRVAPALGGGLVLTTLGGTYVARPAVTP